MSGNAYRPRTASTDINRYQRMNGVDLMITSLRPLRFIAFPLRDQSC